MHKDSSSEETDAEKGYNHGPDGRCPSRSIQSDLVMITIGKI